MTKFIVKTTNLTMVGRVTQLSSCRATRSSSRSSGTGSPAKKEEQAKEKKVTPTAKTKEPSKKKARPKNKQKEESLRKKAQPKKKATRVVEKREEVDNASHFGSCFLRPVGSALSIL
jgi:hypothetical protein